ncbi:hypothetical protein [Microcystis phage Mel-JY03]
MTIRFLPPSYNGGRHLLMCGEIEAGAVFPPVGSDPGRNPWVWRFWLGGIDARNDRHGRASSEEKAKAALMAALADWLEKAGLEAAA